MYLIKLGNVIVCVIITQLTDRVIKTVFVIVSLKQGGPIVQLNTSVVSHI